MDITQPEIVSILFVFAVTVLVVLLVRIFDRMNPVKRERMGFDSSWLVILAIFICVIVWGVLKNKGVV